MTRFHLGPRFNRVFRISLLSYQNNLSNPRYVIQDSNTLFLFTLVRNYTSNVQTSQELRDLQESIERFDPRYVPDSDFGIIGNI